MFKHAGFGSTSHRELQICSFANYPTSLQSACAHHGILESKFHGTSLLPPCTMYQELETLWFTGEISINTQSPIKLNDASTRPLTLTRMCRLRISTLKWNLSHHSTNTLLLMKGLGQDPFATLVQSLCTLDLCEVWIWREAKSKQELGLFAAFI